MSCRKSFYQPWRCPAWRQRLSSCYQALIFWNCIIWYPCLVTDSLISVLGTTELICIQETATLLLWKFVFSFALWNVYPWGNVPTLETFEWFSFSLAKEMCQLLERMVLSWRKDEQDSSKVRDCQRYSLSPAQKKIDNVRGPAMLTGHKVGRIGLAVCKHPTAKQYTPQSETWKSKGRKIRTKENGAGKADW